MTKEQVLEIVYRAIELGVNPRSLPSLRSQFRGIHLSCCDNDDVTDGVPYIESQGFNVYLVDGRNHCLTLTEDLGRATGLLLATANGEDESDVALAS